jgi:mRNA interferase YafQ
MRKPSFSVQFKRDVKLARKRGKDLALLEKVSSFLIDGKILPAHYRDHPLVGNWAHHRECHITSDWLLIYKIFDNEKQIRFERTGTHADLFK